MTPNDCMDLLTQTSFSNIEENDVEIVLDMMPSITMDVTYKTEDEEVIQEGEIVTAQAWISMKHENGLIVLFLMLCTSHSI